ncbi:hypothetical protein ACHHYP_09198 [Achlya hypogyna]|uniref:Secreted protein n=1 Tax=Achlya hypogyna TaxID=1202772 RepID=A0A0A7CMS3_ACHHY|nr:secreted protein [Achlya hypogyna]OQR98068.1 hypothetical protein ACHHYP_09198 [Achlya hypogyna]
MARWTVLAAVLVATVASVPCDVADPFETYEISPCSNPPTSAPSSTPAPTTGAPVPTITTLAPTTFTPAPTTSTTVPTPAPGTKLSLCDYNRQVLSEYYSDIYTDVRRNSANEQFVYDAASQAIVARSNGECLDAYLGANNAFQVHTYPCDATNGNQKWLFNTNTNRIEHATHKGLCMASGPAGNKARVEPCSQSLLQFFSNCDAPTTVGLRFQTCYTNSWLSEYYTGLYADQRRGSVNENWAYDPVAQTLQVASNKECLDAFPVGNGKYGLHTYACDSSNQNQKWVLQGKLVKHAVHHNLCLDADPTDNQHRAQVWDCTPYNKNQCWNLHHY